MKLVSQDREKVIEFKDLFIITAQNGKNGYWAIKPVQSWRSFDLGVYKTFERNKEVLEEVMRAYLKGEKAFYMPEE